MNNVMFSHIIKRYQNLDRKPLDQTQAEAKEVVHFDKVVKVDAEQLKRQNQVLSEDEMVQTLYNVFLVFWVMFVECFY